jgi:hypothetical protein
VTKLLQAVLREVERLPDSDQDAIAAVIQRELEARDLPRRQAGLAALERLHELTRDLPPVDAVKVARDSRKDLEERGAPSFTDREHRTGATSDRSSS